MHRPGGTVAACLACDGCGRVVVIGEVCTPDGCSVGAHVRQTVFNVTVLTVHRDKLYCDACREREARQLDLTPRG